MTELKKPVRRKVPGLLQHGELIITVYTRGVFGFRELGSKREYQLPIMTCYRLAIEADETNRRTMKGKRK